MGGAPLTIQALVTSARSRGRFADGLVGVHAVADALAAMTFAAVLSLVVGAGDQPVEGVARFLRLGVGGVAVGFVLRKILKAAHLAWVDRLLGASVGLLGALFLSAGLSIFLAAGLPGDSRLLADSALAPITLRLSRAIVQLAPPSLRERFDEGLRRFK